MKVSVCITTFNESEKSIKGLFDALNSQSLKPDEIVIIDAKYYNNCSRSKGRNIAIKKAKNKIIAITDVGCIPHRTWLEELTKPFNDSSVDVVAGGYKMVANNNFQRACSVFLGTPTKNMDESFLPSARSMSFTKKIWKKAGGFPEGLKDTAEDTMFNINLINVGAKFKIAKKAAVDWYMPETIYEFFKKIKNYAKGDIESGVWWHPTKKLKTHNIKAITVFARYLLFFYFPWLIIFYLIYSYRKAKGWGIVLQFVSDFAVMTGFALGLFS